jgi:hypothetical protein
MTADTLTPEITRVIEEQVSNNSKQSNKIFAALHSLLNGDYEKYQFNNTINNSLFGNYNDTTDFQEILSKINEKHDGRKETGRFYTPKDVTEYIVANSFLNISDITLQKVYSVENCLKKLTKNKQALEKLLFEYSVFDPTCGTGEFLISALELKFELLNKGNDTDYLNILKTIHGNDINVTSVEITKIRMFFTVMSKLQNYDNLVQVSEILNSNFYKNDFLDNSGNMFNKTDFQKFNIIVGNPPYVEDGKSETKPFIKYGNVYANVLENSAKLLQKEGVMGFILPLSYTATSRMKKIRDIINYYCPQQFLLNYADRPYCLFTGVHQKLTILFCSNQTEKLEIFTSGYNYWYKDERLKLLSDKELVQTKHTKLCYIPKLTNEIEKSIFDRILAKRQDKTFENLAKNNVQPNVFLNMRACFWIKAFSFKQKSNEYKGFSFDEQVQPYILCLLNSSLFFFFWIVVSDCWHITNKELSSFKVILDNLDFEKFKILSQKLEEKLEQTKEYIGTKQTDYAYKHKFCKTEIDLIDNELAKIYDLSEMELDYIKNYHLKYRMSDK